MTKTITVTMNLWSWHLAPMPELPETCPIYCKLAKIGVARNLKYTDSGRVKADLTVRDDYCNFSLNTFGDKIYVTSDPISWSQR